MHYRACCLALFMLVTQAWSVDVRVRGAIQLSPNVLKILRDTSLLEPENIKVRAENEVKSNRANTDFQHFLKKLEKKIISTGTRSLKSDAKYIKIQLDINKINDLTQKVVASYTNQVNAYVNKIIDESINENALEEEILLDVTDKSNKILLKSDKVLRDKSASLAKDVSKEDLKMIAETIRSSADNKKSEDLQYLCKHRGVCKPSSVFIDLFGDLLNMILTIENGMFQELLAVLARLITSKARQLQDFYNPIERILIYSRMHKPKHPINITEILETTKVLIKDRYQIIRHQNEETIYQIRTVRHIFDELDKVFEKDTDYVVENFEKIKTALKQWINGNRNDLETILNTFYVNFVEKCVNYWDGDKKKYIKKLLVTLAESDVTEMTRCVLAQR